MIRVRRGKAPTRLSAGIPIVEECERAFLAAPLEYLEGRRVFDANEGIYGHSEVKDALRKAQNGKCCYCEGTFEANASADVEHYRPKRYVQQKRGSKRIYPGYYWLAYTWENLLFSCQFCNRSHKRNFFPLEDEKSRARCHTDDIDFESPLMVDPAGLEDPREHIQFHDEIAVGLTQRGEVSIGYYGLNRARLLEERLEWLNIVRALRDIVQDLDNPRDREERKAFKRAREKLTELDRPSEKFSAMVQDQLHGASP